MVSVIRRLVLVAALVVGGLIAVVSPASAAPPPATFITCTDKGPTTTVYVVVGGAAMRVSRWQNFGYGGTGEPAHPTPTATSCKSLPLHPANGTFVRGVVANSANTAWQWTGPTYEIIGGAPITVHAWANVGLGSTTPKAVDATVLAASALSGSTSCSSTLAGCLTARPANGTVFAGYDTKAKKATTFYKVDTAIHPVPQKAATAGEKVVDQTSINACERMNCSPNGQIVNIVSGGYGVLHVDGWAQDYPSAASVNVQLSVVDGSTFVVPASQPTDYILASIAGNHGFSADLPIGAGSYVLCGTVLGTAPGATTQDLGCSNVTALGAAPAKMHKPKAKAKSGRRVVVRWKAPSAHGSPISAYIVRCTTGKEKQVSGRTHKVVFKHLRRGQKVGFKVRALNAIGLGHYSKSSKKIAVR